MQTSKETDYLLLILYIKILLGEVLCSLSTATDI